MFGKKVKQGRDSKANWILELNQIKETDEELFQIRGKDTQPKRLEAVTSSKVLSNKTAVQQLPVTGERAKSSSKRDQQDHKLLHTKEELWTNQDKEQYCCLEENVTTLPVTPALLRDEDGEEKSQASSSVQLSQTQTQGSREAEAGINVSDEQMQTETDGEPFRGAETTRSPHPVTDGKTLGSSMSEVRDDSDDFVYEYWQKPLSDSELESEDSDSSFDNSSAHKSGVSTDEEHGSAKKSLFCAKCGKQYCYRLSFQKHVMCHSEKDLPSFD